MDKLYYIVCEEKDRTLFEGRCQCRTRGAALKFLKEQLGRPNLNGLVFTITEIPVPLIREIVQAILENRPMESVTVIAPEPVRDEEPEPPIRFDAFKRMNEFPVEEHEDEEVSEDDAPDSEEDAPDSDDAPDLDDASDPEDAPDSEDEDMPPALMRKPRQRQEDTHDWTAIKAYYLDCRSPKKTAEHFQVKLTTLLGRIKRKGWSKERRAS